MFPPYVGEKLEPAFLKKSAGKPYAKTIPRGVLAEDWITENNALLAASMGLPFVRAGGGGAVGRVGTAATRSTEYTDGSYSETDSEYTR
jgi:hypothetical protein